MPAPVRQIVPDVAARSNVGANLFGQLGQIGAQAFMQSANLWEQEQNANAIQSGIRQTVFDPGNMQELGLNNDQAEALVERYKRQPGESLQEYKDRSQTLLKNISYWDEAKKQTPGIRLPDPNIDSDTFRAAIDAQRQNISGGIMTEAALGRPAETLPQGVAGPTQSAVPPAQTQEQALGRAAPQLAEAGFGGAAQQAALGALPTRRDVQQQQYREAEQVRKNAETALKQYKAAESQNREHAIDTNQLLTRLTSISNTIKGMENNYNTLTNKLYGGLDKKDPAIVQMKVDIEKMKVVRDALIKATTKSGVAREKALMEGMNEQLLGEAEERGRGDPSSLVEYLRARERDEAKPTTTTVSPYDVQPPLAPQQATMGATGATQADEETIRQNVIKQLRDRGYPVTEEYIQQGIAHLKSKGLI